MIRQKGDLVYRPWLASEISPPILLNVNLLGIVPELVNGERRDASTAPNASPARTLGGSPGTKQVTVRIIQGCWQFPTDEKSERHAASNPRQLAVQFIDGQCEH